MAGRSDIQAGAAFIRLYAKDADLVKGLKAAKEKLQQFGANVSMVGRFIGGLGAAIIGPLGGAVVSFMKRNKEMVDSMAMIRKQVEGVADAIGEALMPIIRPAIEAFSKFLKTAAVFIEKNQGLVRVIALLGGGLVAVGGVLIGAGQAMSALGAACGIAATLLPFIVSALGLLVSPAGLVIAALAAGTLAFLKFTKSGQAAAAFIGESFAAAFEFVKIVIGGIGNALAAGDLALAANIGWSAVMLVFETAKLKIMKIWFTIREALLAGWGEVSLGIQTGVAFIASVFAGFLDQLVPSWRGVMAILGIGWESFKNTAIGAFKVISVGLNGLIDKLKNFLKGLQTAVGIGMALSPEAAGNSVVGGGAAVKAFTGIDVNKIFGDATGVAGDVNAKGRDKLTAAADKRRAGDEAALTAQEKEIAARQVELSNLIKDAADAKANFDAKAPRIGENLAPKAAAFGSFSGAALGLAGGQGGAMDRVVKAVDDAKAVALKHLEATERLSRKVETALSMS